MTDSLRFPTRLFRDPFRERDNIIWRVPVGAVMFPIYSTFVNYVPCLELRPQKLIARREYFCHDRNLHEMWALPITEDFGKMPWIRPGEYMVYEFPRYMNDGTGWLLGFASHYENFIAYDVEIESFDELDINDDAVYHCV
jgi:hypothetical protein